MHSRKLGINMAIVSLLLLAIALTATRAEYCFSTDRNPHRLYATKTAYDDVRNQDTPRNETPDGCEAISMYLVARHGSRYGSVSSQGEIAAKLSVLREIVLQSPNDLCADDREALIKWEPLFEPSEDRTLAQRGWREFRTLGQRYRTRVPEILDRQYDENLFHFQHTDYSGKGDRTKSTARAFVEGLWGSYNGVKLVESTQPDWLIHFYKFCDKYEQTVDELPEFEHDSFNEGPYMQEVLRRMETRLGLEASSLTYDLARDIYESCRVEYLVRDGLAPWCVAFTKEDLIIFEYSQDLSYYWQTSYPYEISSAQSCPLMADMVQRFQEAISGEGRIFAGRFGHSTTINTFFTLLGLHYDPQQLTASNFEDMEDRNWRVSLNAPMGSNGAFILYSCDSSPTYRVKTFINERPTILPQCQDYVCDLDDVLSSWGPIAASCDIDEICKWPEDDLRITGCEQE